MNKNETMVSFEEFNVLVHSVVAQCFDIDGNFTPGVRNTALKQVYALNFLKLDLNDDFEANYSKYAGIDLTTIDNPQFCDLIAAVDENIEWRKAKLLNKNINVTTISEFDDLVAPIIAIFNTMNAKLKKVNVKKLNDQLNSLDLTTLLEKFVIGANGSNKTED